MYLHLAAPLRETAGSGPPYNGWPSLGTARPNRDDLFFSQIELIPKTDEISVRIRSTSALIPPNRRFLIREKIRLKLPRGSRVMETGGYKGRRMAVARPVLVRRITERLGVPAFRVINEYGMTELTSQFYDVSLKNGKASSVKGIPAWTRVLIVDPVTGRPVAKSRRGLIRIIDLANVGSCLAIQTEDEGRLVGSGFEILGRKKGADLRGCSLSFEELGSLRDCFVAGGGSQ